MRTLLTLLISGLTALGAITTNYVATDGNNANAGTLAAPWRNISYGLSNMVAGGVLILRGGDYEEANICDLSSGSGWMLKDGTLGQNTIIKSYPGERAVFFPTNVSCIHPSGTQHGIGFGAMNANRPGPAYMTLDGWTIDLSKRPSFQRESQQANFQVLGGNHMILTNMHFLNTTNGSQVHFSAPAQNTSLPYDARWGNSNIITGCLFSNIWNVDINGDGVFSVAHHSIYSYPCRNIIVENSTFRSGHSVAVGFGSDHADIALYSIVTNAIIRNNDIADFAFGINLRRNYFAQVYNNIIRNCGIGTQPWAGRGAQYPAKHGLWLHARGNRIYNNTFWNCHNGIAFNRLTHYYNTYVYENVIENNIFWNMAGEGLYWENNPLYPTIGTNTIRNNLALSYGGASGWQTWWADQIMSGNLFGSAYNPALVDPPTDFRIAANSPAVAAGLDLSAYFTTDYYGETRTDPWDLGAIKAGSDGGGEDPDPPVVELPLVSVVQTGDAFELGQVFSTFTITRAGSLDGNLNVVFAMTGSAVSNVNYTLSHSSPMTIANAEAAATLTLTPVDLSTIGTMDAILTIVPDAAYTVSSVNSATMTIYGSGQVQPGFRRTFGGGAATGRRGL